MTTMLSVASSASLGLVAPSLRVTAWEYRRDSTFMLRRKYQKDFPILHNSSALLWFCPSLLGAQRPHRAPLEVKCQCAEHGGVSSDDKERTENSSGQRDFLRVGALIGLVTVGSKILGLARETVLAAVFGIGPVMDAYSYASIVPGFFLVLLGGLNGPFHSALASSLSKRSREEWKHLIKCVTFISAMVCGALSVGIASFAAPLVDTVAPGLKPSSFRESLTRDLAIVQLRFMAPCAPLAALIGVGFGTLSAVGAYGLPSFSPALSSISIMIPVVLISLLSKAGKIVSNSYVESIALAGGTTFGAIVQLALQSFALQRCGLGPSLLFSSSSDCLGNEGVQEIFAILLPAAVASGLLQLATFTDLYFASFIPGAAAGLGYANLLVMAPLGIISSAVLVPLLPMFSRLSELSDKSELQERVKQALLLSMTLTALMSALLVALAKPIVRLVFQRKAFDISASNLVSSLLICYALGSSFYLARDILVRVFYSLGESHVPFYVSVIAILSNVILDWIAVRYLYLGPEGLVIATSLVSFASAVVLLQILSERMGGLKMRHWVKSVGLIAFSACITGVFAGIAHRKLSFLLIAMVRTSSHRFIWLAELSSTGIASIFGVCMFSLLLFCFRTPEMEGVMQLARSKF